MTQLTKPGASGSDAKVSVCMAVHNGERFLRAQIDSILGQLRPGDELVVVDDASRDDSLAVLRRVSDSRVRIECNPRNLGVLATFENALLAASGEIMFLSDQDDVWLPGKLSKSLETFASDSRVTMVVTDARVVDENGNTLVSSFFAQRGRFTPDPVRNFIKNKYLGCTIGFRRQMLSVFLPIPRDVPMHDIWFGILNGIYGRTAYIDEPLVAYRRHGRNASPVVSPGFFKAVRWRYCLAKNVASRVISRALNFR